MNDTTQNLNERAKRAAGAPDDTSATRLTAPQVLLCAVADDGHVQDVIATGRALERTGNFRALVVHVPAPSACNPVGVRGPRHIIRDGAPATLVVVGSHCQRADRLAVPTRS